MTRTGKEGPSFAGGRTAPTVAASLWRTRALVVRHRRGTITGPFRVVSQAQKILYQLFPRVGEYALGMKLYTFDGKLFVP